MKDNEKKELDGSIDNNQALGLDADNSEQKAGIYSNLLSDDGENYDPEQDSTPELERRRIGDKG